MMSNCSVSDVKNRKEIDTKIHFVQVITTVFTWIYITATKFSKKGERSVNSKLEKI